MSLAKVKTCALSGIDAQLVEVEVAIKRGLPKFSIIGLGDSAVREARDRVESALKRSGFKIPDQILVNLAPAELKKEGSAFDLPIALGILAAAGELKGISLEEYSFFGELSLDGTLKPVSGVIAQAITALQNNIFGIVIPLENVLEAQVIKEIRALGFNNLLQVVRYLRGEALELQSPDQEKIEDIVIHKSFSEVIGQEKAVKALSIAAAGAHNILMIGTPGSGKSMLAERFPNILPPLTEQEMHEVMRIHSIASQTIKPFLHGKRPYRSPHHNVSSNGLVGGGTVPRPGEISLAHNGVLFLDEFPEFNRSAIESMRNPMESGAVSITRARGSYTFPASFQLIAAMNPCPCGRLGVSEDSCMCSLQSIQNYIKKISGPILDRIDLQIELRPVSIKTISDSKRRKDETFDDALRANVIKARQIALRRQNKANAFMDSSEISEFIAIDDKTKTTLNMYAENNNLSARSYFRILKVSRTVADLKEKEQVDSSDIIEALGFRALDTLHQYVKV